MAVASCSHEEFIRLFKQHGANELAKILGVSARAVYARRKRIENESGSSISSPTSTPSGLTVSQYASCYPSRVPLICENGIIMVGSDAHIWPGPKSTAVRGFQFLIRELQPKAVGLNGDVFDGARISRHPPIGWTHKPTVKQELEAVRDVTDDIAKDAPQGCELFWTLGNHDQRFENSLVAKNAEFEGVNGVLLKDHFARWKFCMSLWVNDTLVIKHRFKGGIHATHNNTLMAGKSIETGHLHSLKVTPFDDYNGTRYGIDTGTLQDPYGEQFDYQEDNPRNHRSGFIVNTFFKGKLLWPEVAAVVDPTHIQFRGKVYEV